MDIRTSDSRDYKDHKDHTIHLHNSHQTILCKKRTGANDSDMVIRMALWPNLISTNLILIDEINLKQIQTRTTIHRHTDSCTEKTHKIRDTHRQPHQ